MVYNLEVNYETKITNGIGNYRTTIILWGIDCNSRFSNKVYYSLGGINMFGYADKNGGSMLYRNKERLYDIDKMSKLYDRIYAIADKLLKKHNPCNIHVKNSRLYCSCHTAGCHKKYMLCCNGCKYGVSEHGCTVKALGCKLFLCHIAGNKIFHRQMKRLREFTRKHLMFYYYENGNRGEYWCYSIADKYFVSKQDWLNIMEDKLHAKSTVKSVSV